ncbi:hypothetical protein HZS_2094 [Henneguya salminicola]|nr:hypothetical protein HZS_2094 [Henneguya salminicola]
MAKFYICCNKIPSFDCYDQARSNRMRFVNFETKFTFSPKHKNDKKIDKTQLQSLVRLDEIIEQNVISEEQEMLMKFPIWCCVNLT